MLTGRDSGYCENMAAGSNDRGHFGRAAQRTDFSGMSPLVPAPPPSTADPPKDCMVTGSSCRALRHAVSTLNRLDDFNTEKIGSGFFSEVFKVTHRVTGEVMVLKMNQLRSNRPNMLKEVQLMNRLCHPNILGFMGACVHEGQLHALTEYINGGSLEQLIQTRSIELTYSVRMKLALDIARGVEYLHSRDIFHRDLTSKNVLIKKSEETGELTAVVGDFGLAAKIPKCGYRLPTVGSPYWMSPECLKGQWYDECSDTFSYGIVLCELIARIEADPDCLPRTENFGLDYIAFVELCADPPPPPAFLRLAFSCCNFEPKNRPVFSEIVRTLEREIANGVVEFNQAHLGREKERSKSIGAHSEEFLTGSAASAMLPQVTASGEHKKLSHRRSLSEDNGIFPPHTAPSDKARCHFKPNLRPALKTVGETMAREDPYYKPAAPHTNPFTLTHFKGVKKILASANSTDLFSSCFELQSRTASGDPPPANPSSSVVAEPVLKPSHLRQLYLRGKQPCDTSLYQEQLSRDSADEDISPASLKARPRHPSTPHLKPKPHSLPSSPTFTRRTPHQRPATNPAAQPLFSFRHPHASPLRACCSGSNLASLDQTSPPGTLLLAGATPLRRRGSCESGFFSSVGEDFCLPGIEFVTASSVTLSSSSAASSLFLDTSGAAGLGLSCSLEDIATPLRHPHHHHHHYPHHLHAPHHKRSSSTYTDSSEDVSSLGGGDLDERSSLQAPQQISKIVEYFERKQSSNGGGGLTDTQGHKLRYCHQLPREYYHRLQRSFLHESRSTDIVRLGRSLERSAACDRGGKRGGVNQRLMICEGAVRSKLQLFDKK